ncbi:hypothetical protein GE061_016782 [Apolygus lucorum]|uniref:Uncharacterized protein n=1 Tax=Apolygus lucorum TaxID=248454 RepID=A0A8S9XJ95_APOLU|nr:hypothetical protein GE061_016782 [Apolygus lucorum]
MQDKFKDIDVVTHAYHKKNTKFQITKYQWYKLSHVGPSTLFLAKSEGNQAAVIEDPSRQLRGASAERRTDCGAKLKSPDFRGVKSRMREKLYQTEGLDRTIRNPGRKSCPRSETTFNYGEEDGGSGNDVVRRRSCHFKCGPGD